MHSWRGRCRVIADRSACFEQPGITVFDFIEDVHPYLQSCSITINPDKECSGKFAESHRIAGGRARLRVHAGRGARAYGGKYALAGHSE